MRWYALGLIALSLSGCGAKYKGDTPAIDNWERVSGWAEVQTSRARYTGSPIIAAPIVPVMAFGATFDLDVEVQTKEGRYTRTHLGRVATPDGALWVALESNANDGEQVLLADVDPIDALWPELPLERKRTSMVVEDTSNAEHVELSFHYQNADGEPVELKVESNTPWKLERQRNRSFEGQSEASLLLHGDLAARQSAFQTQLKVDGETRRPRKMGLVPYQFVGTQAIGGLAVGEYRLRQTEVFSFEPASAGLVVHGQELPPAAPVVDSTPDTPAPDPLAVALATHHDALQACYSSAADSNPELAGQVLFTFHLADGASRDLRLIQNTTEDEELAGCLEAALAAGEYPTELQGDFGYPLIFVAGKGLDLRDGTGDPDEARETRSRDAEPESRETRSRDAEPEGRETRMRDEAVDETELDDLAELPSPDELTQTLEEELPSLHGATLGAFSTLHTMASGQIVEMPWEVSRQGERVFAVQHSDVRTLAYEYLVRHDALELARISVTQYGHAVPSVEVAFSPALPDLRRHFDGRQRSRFAIDVNGQRNHGVGSVEAWWTESGVRLRMVPEGPKWAEGRTLVTDIAYERGGRDGSGASEVRVRTRRVE